MDNSGFPYWKKQIPGTALFPDIEWSKPEQRGQAGRLGIVGGNKLGFAGVAEAYETALKTGTGEIRVLLPDALKKAIPPTMTDAIFAPTNPSGSLSKDASAELGAIGEWASGMLLIGDAGRSSETAILYEEFVQKYAGPLIITRDAMDLIKNNPTMLAERPDTLLVISFAQAQKLFQSLYYPKILTFSMQLTNMVEALHKFTITYPVGIMTLHKDTIIIAQGGDVITMPWVNPMAIWRGQTATRAAAYWLWTPKKQLEAIASSIV